MFLYKWAKVITWLILVVITEAIAIIYFDLSPGAFFGATTLNLAFWGLVMSKNKASTTI